MLTQKQVFVSKMFYLQPDSEVPTMSIIRMIQPGRVLGWKEFCDTVPGNSIALDGIVSTGPMFDPRGPHINFNHHEGVDRLATRATCAQVLMVLRQGLLETFKPGNGALPVRVYMNDPDQDVALAVFLLEHPFMVMSTMNPLVNQLVAMEDMLDTTAAAYAFPADLPSLAKVMWVFEPYDVFRANGGIARQRADEYDGIITDVGGRIMRFLTGSAQSVALDTNYEVIEGGKGYKIVVETGRHARVGMFASGIRAFVTILSSSAGVYRYTVGRVSQFVPFDVPAILEALNVAEMIPPGETDRWGGGNTIGGSPRKKGSNLTPNDVKRVIDEVLSRPL